MSVVMLQVLIIIGIMIVVGALIGFIAGLIWKDNRPIGVKGDYLIIVLLVLKGITLSQSSPLLSLVWESGS
jgi:hypothetical protein